MSTDMNKNNMNCICKSDEKCTELANGSYISMRLNHDSKGFYINAIAEDITDPVYINFCPICGRKLATDKLSRNKFKRHIYEKTHIDRHLINNIIDSVCNAHFENEKQLYDMLENVFGEMGVSREDINKLDLYS